MTVFFVPSSAFERSQEEKAKGVDVTYDPRLVDAPRQCLGLGSSEGD